MTFAACPAQLDVSMVKIADLSDGCIAYLVDQPNFAGRHAHLGKITFLCQHLRRTACGTDQLPAAALLQFDIVDERANRDVGDRQAVAWTDFRSGSSYD